MNNESAAEAFNGHPSRRITGASREVHRWKRQGERGTRSSGVVFAYSRLSYSSFENGRRALFRTLPIRDAAHTLYNAKIHASSAGVQRIWSACKCSLGADSSIDFGRDTHASHKSELCFSRFSSKKVLWSPIDKISLADVDFILRLELVTPGL